MKGPIFTDERRLPNVQITSHPFGPDLQAMSLGWVGQIHPCVGCGGQCVGYTFSAKLSCVYLGELERVMNLLSVYQAEMENTRTIIIAVAANTLWLACQVEK